MTPEETKTRRNARDRARYAENGEAMRARAEKWAGTRGGRVAVNKMYYEKSCDKNIAKSKNWRANNPERNREINLNSLRRKRYGLDVETFNAMWQAQGFTCATCGSAPAHSRDINVDHCHTTGRVRGILCRNCNWALGFARDNPATLRAMVAYLEKRVSTVDTSLETCE